MNKRATSTEEIPAVKAGSAMTAELLSAIKNATTTDLVGRQWGGWREVVEVAADTACGDEWTEALAPVQEIVNRLMATDKRLALEIDSALGSAAVSLSTRYALVGFALAKTWPDSPEKLVDWPSQARKYVDNVDE